MAFKIAYGAGHNNHTANGIPKALDANNTNEWLLNDRVARHFAAAAQQYENVELLRVDDPKGEKPVDLSQRCKDANAWGADFFLSIHHNAGINLGSGGGLVAFCYKAGTTAEKYQKAIYNACIAAGGLKGNRSDPTPEKGYYVLVNTDAPAVLMEYGFMDSRTDAPVILQEDYAKRMAYATMEGIAEVAGLKKKAAAENNASTASNTFYRVQVGAFNDPANAERLRDELKAKGYKDAFVVTVKR